MQLLPKLISQRVQPERKAWANVVSQSTRGRHCARFHTAATGETPPAGNGGALRIFDSNRAISPLAKPLDRFAGKRPLYTSFGPSGHLPERWRASNL